MRDITISSGVAVADTTFGDSLFKITLTGNVSSFSFFSRPPGPADVVTVLFEQDATGGRTVAFAGTIVNAPGISATASSVTAASFAFDPDKGTWQTIASAVAGTLASAILASVAATAQAANISTATAYAVPTGGAGMYRVCVYIDETQAATTSSTMPAVTIGWTDDSATGQTLAVTSTSTANAVGTYARAETNVYAAAGTNITYATGSYASSGGTAMQYSLYVTVEKV